LDTRWMPRLFQSQPQSRFLSASLLFIFAVASFASMTATPNPYERSQVSVSDFFLWLHGGWLGRQVKFPPEEVVWGTVVPQRPGRWGQRRVGGGGSLGALPLRGIGLNGFSFQTLIRAWPRVGAGQHNMTYPSGEAERGCGSIYGDGSGAVGPG